jgi:hypothetical protein
VYRRREKISKDETAQKKADLLIRELGNKRKEIENRKRSELEKMMAEVQKEEEEGKRRKEEEAVRVKEEKRQAIALRMEDEKQRRQERKLIAIQSNHLISKLKKEEELEKAMSAMPNQIFESELQTRALEKKPMLDFKGIEDHGRKYYELKEKTKREKEEKGSLFKLQHQQQNGNPPRYARNRWSEQVKEENQRRKEEERELSQRKKRQLEARLKYGEQVKSIFLPRKKEDHGLT